MAARSYKIAGESGPTSPSTMAVEGPARPGSNALSRFALLLIVFCNNFPANPTFAVASDFWYF
jgi:hypothetical protein